jgi:hypothetical protein
MAQTIDEESEKAGRPSEGSTEGQAVESKNSKSVALSSGGQVRVLREKEEIPVYRIDLDLPPQERYVWSLSSSFPSSLSLSIVHFHCPFLLRVGVGQRWISRMQSLLTPS